jgi:ribonuclease BN (tRNA processing enzyme)
MRLVTLGVSGSMPGPASPASCYLLQADDGERRWSVVLDLGSGSLGALQRQLDPSELDAVALSHLHPDHCADLSGLYVYLRYHPTHGSQVTGSPRHLPVLGPEATRDRAAQMYGLVPGEDMDAEYAFRTWTPGEPVQVGPFTLEVFEVLHPIEAYAVRVTGPSTLRRGERATLTYSGDTDACDNLVEAARDVDVLLCEAAFVEGRDDDVRGIHLTGRRAGKVAADAGARRLLLTHLQPWTEPETVLGEAREEFDGPAEVVMADGTYLL